MARFCPSLHDRRRSRPVIICTLAISMSLASVQAPPLAPVLTSDLSSQSGARRPSPEGYSEVEEPREIGRAHSLPLGQCSKRHAIAVAECGIEPVRPDQQRDESCIRFGCGKRVDAIDPHHELAPGAA